MKQPKPVKAWSYVDRNGKLRKRVWETKRFAELVTPNGGYAVRVVIRPVKKGD